MLQKRRVFTFGIETTAGTAVTLNASNGCFCFDPVMQAEIPMNSRVATGSLSQLPGVTGARRGSVSFSVELAGGGSTALPSWGPLMTCCGMKLTGSGYGFTSNTVDYNTATIGIYEDGRFKVLAGCQGTWSLEGEYGKPLMVKFEFHGVWLAPTDAAMVALPSFAVIPPRFASATFTLGGFQPKISKFSLEAGNTLQMIEDVTKASGYGRCIITGRNVKGKIDPLAELVATEDYYGLWIAGTTAALNVVIGSVANNTITIAAPYIQTTNVQEAARNELVVDDLDFVATATYAGDNELSITFS